MRIMAPIWQSQISVTNSFWNLTNFIKSKNALIQENETLKKQVASDVLLLQQSQATRNALIGFQLGYDRSGNTQGIVAAVLVRPPETPYDILIVGAGADNNVQVGNIVTIREGARVGKVIEIFTKTSKVKLYSANGEKTGAILERNAVPIELLGQGGGSLLFVLPREINVEVGDKILSPSIEGSLIGVVRNIEVTPTDSFKKVLVESVAPVNSLRLVLILP